MCTDKLYIYHIIYYYYTIHRSTSYIYYIYFVYTICHIIYITLYTILYYTHVQVYLKSLWNGKYLDYDNSKSDHHDSIMADMLAGHWYCRATDLESFLSKHSVMLYVCIRGVVCILLCIYSYMLSFSLLYIYFISFRMLLCIMRLVFAVYILSVYIIMSLYSWHKLYTCILLYLHYYL